MWNAPRQPVWAVPWKRDGGTDWMIVFRAYADRSPHDPARGTPTPDAISLGEARVGGKWWKGRWSFVECYLNNEALERLCLAAQGEWIRDRLLGGRIPGVVRTLSEAQAGGTPCLECWCRL